MDTQDYKCGPNCGSDCPNCGGKRAEKKQSYMALGYNEEVAELLTNEVYPVDFSEDTLDMVMTRLKVIVGRCGDILEAVNSARMMGGQVEMDAWMVDKITLSADYLSAVADNAKFGDGIDRVYGEKKGLWANIHAKRERIKRGSGERMRKPGEKGAPSAKDLKDAGKDDKKD